MEKLLIGLDFGSDSVRAVLVGEKGRIYGSAVSEYPRWKQGLYCDAAQSQFRQHPLDYLESMDAAVRQVLQGVDGKQVCGIGVDTTGSTPCAVNSEGVPLSLLPGFAGDPDAMFLLWKDHTGQAESDHINAVAAEWKTHGEDYLKYEGGIYSAEWFFSKLLHILRHSEKVRSAAASFVEHCDWITAELCGDTRLETLHRSRCAAGHKAMWHADWGGLPSNDFLKAIDPLLDGWGGKLYGETQTADVPVGKISRKWAEKWGLTEQVTVAGGTFDAHAGAVGAQIGSGGFVKICGTSSCDMLVAPNVKKCIPGICGQVDGSIIPGMTGFEAGQSAFGDVFAWFVRLLSYGGRVDLPSLERDAVAIPPGSTKIAALDWFNGRRTPFASNSLTGVIAGLNLGSTAPMVYRALVECTVYGTRAIVDRYREEGVEVKSMIVSGGISRKSPFVLQTMADVLNMTIKVPACDQTCALGTAMFAAVCSGVYPDIFTAMDSMGAGYDMTFTPNAAVVPVYEKLYQNYKRLGAAYQNFEENKRTEGV